MKKKNLPDIGTAMYSVHEHFYYIPGHVAPVKEYCVCDAEVKEYFQEGRYAEIRLVGKLPGRGMTPYHYSPKDVGTRLFYSPREAAEQAKRMTEKYENTWDVPPMRRTWEKFLEDPVNE